MAPYEYPETNSYFIGHYNLQEHPEGGYFVQTEILDETRIPSPYADGALRPLATQIYYLLTPGSNSRGYMHMNKSATFHLHHAGRSLYTLVKPGSLGSPPELKRVVLGGNSAAGEVKQLFVDGGWWKASEIPAEDLSSAEEGGDHVRERTGCLISEVVAPGFDFQDHAFLDEKKLEGLAGGDEKLREDLGRYVRRSK